MELSLLLLATSITQGHPGQRPGWPTARNDKATRRWPGRLHVRLTGLVQVLEAEVGGFDEAFRAAAVETLTLEFVGQYATVLGLLHQGVGDLDLATLARLGLLDQVEDVRVRM